jgi:hypothetical protein
MFAKTSRYAPMSPYTVTLKDGTQVRAVPSPLPGPALVAGYHRRLAGQRLDSVAFHYMRDATGFWRLCDAGNTMVPDALGAADFVGVPPDAPVRS